MDSLAAKRRGMHTPGITRQPINATGGGQGAAGLSGVL